MDTPEKYSKNGMGEGNPGHIDPNEINRKDIAKNLTTHQKPDIKESGFGREQGQMPTDEHLGSMEQTLKKEFDTDDFRRVDERDNGDSAEEWNAEKSRTSHNK
jgi:hypothetical protein